MRRLLLRYGVFLLTIVLLVAAWSFAARVIHLPIILPDPFTVLRETVRLVNEPGFARTLTATVARGLSAFAFTAVTGLIIGVAGGVSRLFEAGFRPLFGIIQATPVISVILLALIWFPTGSVPVFVAVLMSFPVVYSGVARGVREIDGELAEMALLFRVRPLRRLRELYLPSLFPYLVASLGSALGLTWKVVIAAEVLAQPRHAVGSELQVARIQLETAQVFAWTVIALLLSAATDLIFAFALHRIERLRGRTNRANGDASAAALWKRGGPEGYDRDDSGGRAAHSGGA